MQKTALRSVRRCVALRLSHASHPGQCVCVSPPSCFLHLFSANAHGAITYWRSSLFTHRQTYFHSAMQTVTRHAFLLRARQHTESLAHHSHTHFICGRSLHVSRRAHNSILSAPQSLASSASPRTHPAPTAQSTRSSTSHLPHEHQRNHTHTISAHASAHITSQSLCTHYTPVSPHAAPHNIT